MRLTKTFLGVITKKKVWVQLVQDSSDCGYEGLVQLHFSSVGLVELIQQMKSANSPGVLSFNKMIGMDIFMVLLLSLIKSWIISRILLWEQATRKLFVACEWQLLLHQLIYPARLSG